MILHALPAALFQYGKKILFLGLCLKAPAAVQAKTNPCLSGCVARGDHLGIGLLEVLLKAHF